MAPSHMQAIHFAKGGDPSVLTLTTLPVPKLETPYDILVKINACALNPVDTKVRKGSNSRVLGWDAAGVVEAAAPEALFKPGDEVMYMGNIGRNGANAQYNLVDSRLVGRKPKGWSWEDAAALPLVGLTAWEMLEGHFNLKPGATPPQDETILIVNGAGGVGSIATQLAAKVFEIKNVVVTASRPETIEWAKRNGATHTVNHREPLAPQFEKLGLKASFAFICYDTPTYLEQVIDVMRPWGRIGSIVETTEPLKFNMPAFSKALSFHWEFVFAKPLKEYDVASQGRMLNDIAQFAEEGKITTLVHDKEILSVASLRKRHEITEAGKAIGKTVFTVPDTISES